MYSQPLSPWGWGPDLVSPVGLWERWPELLKGRLFRLEPPEEFWTLLDEARQLVRTVFDPYDPLMDATRLSAEAWWKRLSTLRGLVSQQNWEGRYLEAFLRSWGWPRGGLLTDRVRIRGVWPGWQDHPQARLSGGLHRDDWYANPPGQVNWWIPLWDVEPDLGLEIYPEHWARPIANSSARFALETWEASGGFQKPSPRSDGEFPEIQAPPEGPAVPVGCAAGRVLLFASHHLHGTRQHKNRLGRWTLEWRTLRPDLEGTFDPPNVDNQSQGSTRASLVPRP